MAKLNKSGTEILWRMELKDRSDDGRERFQRYALRSDGVLLSQFIVELDSGRHNYGWKVSTKKPYQDVKDRLKKIGYLEMASR